MTKNLAELTPLVDALKSAAARQHSAFYAPGHKRGQGIAPSLKNLFGRKVFSADLPELPELDNLFAPGGPILEAQELASRVFGAEQTWFLVNGSTCGIEAAILATCATGDKIILPRNIHQSAIAGLILSGAEPVFINPVYSADEGLAYNVTPESVRKALVQNPDVKAVLMLHPTYQGIGADLGKIAQLTHEYDIPLLVDEAHGAHFGFHPDLPPNALSLGADLVVQSTHKTLGALTQGAMLHCQGKRIARYKISKALQLTQSTSPSYLLLAALDMARQQIATQGKMLMEQTITLAQTARQQLREIPNLRLFEPSQQSGCEYCDPTRLTINLRQLGITGFAADEILHEQFGVTCELPLIEHLTFIISLGNTPLDIGNLVQGFKNLPQYIQPQASSQDNLELPQINPKMALSPREAYFAPKKTILLKNVGQNSAMICGELICPYPPGIPLLMPGELITPETTAYLQQVMEKGGTITGCKDPTLQTIQILN